MGGEGGLHSPGSSTRESFIRISGIFPYSRARDEWDFSFLFPNFFFISCSTLFPSNRRREEEEGPIGSSCHSLPVTYECRKFSTDASLPLDEKSAVLSSGKIARDPTENIRYCWKFIGLWIFSCFFFFLEVKEELIFLEN